MFVDKMHVCGRNGCSHIWAFSVWYHASVAVCIEKAVSMMDIVKFKLYNTLILIMKNWTCSLPLSANTSDYADGRNEPRWRREKKLFLGTYH